MSRQWQQQIDQILDDGNEKTSRTLQAAGSQESEYAEDYESDEDISSPRQTIQQESSTRPYTARTYDDKTVEDRSSSQSRKC